MDGLVHASVSADPLAAARHSLFIAGHLAVGAVSLALFPAYLLLRGGLTAAEALVLAVLASPIAIAIYLARTGRFEAANTLSAFAASALVAILAAASGGIGSAFVICLPLVALRPVIAGARRAFLPALGMAVATAIGLALAGVAGLLTPALSLPSWLQPAVTLAVLAYAAGIAAAHLRFQTMDAATLRSGEARYATLAETMDDLVTRHGEGGRVSYASPAASSIVGAPAASLIGQGLFERVHVSDRPAYLAALSAARQGTPQTAEFRLRQELQEGRGFRFIWIEMRCQSFGAGANHHVVAILRDVSDRKAQEEAAQAARIEAEKANATKGQFLAMMSHELRTPLNAIIGFSEMLMNERQMGIDIDRRREYAGLIRDSGEHLLGVVNSVLDMSKIESGSLHIVGEAFALPDLIDGCCALMLLKAEAGGISLRKAVEAGLPELVADKRACRQICLNLMSNALKFTPAGGIVTVGARSEAGGVALFVSDTGVGVAHEDLPRLGEAFFQASSSYGRSFEGTGLGLSVVKGLAELHGGRLEVDSQVGRGTIVTVHLPLDCEAATAAGRNVEPLRPRGGQAGSINRFEDQGKKRA